MELKTEARRCPIPSGGKAATNLNQDVCALGWRRPRRVRLSHALQVVVTVPELEHHRAGGAHQQLPPHGQMVVGGILHQGSSRFQGDAFGARVVGCRWQWMRAREQCSFSSGGHSLRGGCLVTAGHGGLGGIHLLGLQVQDCTRSLPVVLPLDGALWVG
jgi:hypothetical protein